MILLWYNVLLGGGGHFYLNFIILTYQVYEKVLVFIRTGFRYKIRVFASWKIKKPGLGLFFLSCVWAIKNSIHNLFFKNIYITLRRRYEYLLTLLWWIIKSRYCIMFTLPGQSVCWQAWLLKASPTHAAPPWAGGGLEQCLSLVLTPWPHVTEHWALHWDQPPHPPSTD